MEERVLLATATYAAINLINSSGYTAAEVLDGTTPDPTNPTTTQTFTTSFLGVNDVTITPSVTTPSSDYVLHVGDSFPPVTSANESTDNNPSTVTSFVGSPLPPGQALQGTGTGLAGSIFSLLMSDGNSITIDFKATALPAGSLICFGDIDGTEKVTVTASGPGKIDMSSWKNIPYSGTSNETPTGKWATWSGSGDTGTWTAGGKDLSGPLNVLEVGQSVNQLVISESGGDGGVTYQILSPGSSLTAVSGAGTYGGSATVSATLTSVNGTPLAKKLVTFETIAGGVGHGGTPTPVGFATTDENGVATFSSASLAGFSAGDDSGSLMAVFSGDSTDSPTTAYGDLDVAPAPLSVSANPQTMTYGALVPILTPSYSGFVNGDTAVVLSGAPPSPPPRTVPATSAPIPST